jgi:hypothetical protein
MYRIKIFSDFCTSEICKTKFESTFNSNKYDFYGENKQMYITTEDDYTHAIILNTAMPELNIPKKNVIGLAFEPVELLDLTKEFIMYADKYIGKYLIGKNNNLPKLFVEHFAFMWHNNPCKEIAITQKKKKMSIVFSNKNLAPGHIYRILLVKEILREKLPIDIYGYGCNLIKERRMYENVKGNFQNVEPYEDYLFSICIENYQSNDYISEKLLDPLLHNCNPIYLGAKNINTYFNNIIQLKGNLLFDIEMLKVILKNPLKYYCQTYNERNLKRVNFFENIHQYFE